MDERLFYNYNAWRGGAFALSEDIIECDIYGRALKFIRGKEILSLLGLRQTGKSTLAFLANTYRAIIMIYCHFENLHRCSIII